MYNVSLLSLIKQHEEGLTLEEIKKTWLGDGIAPGAIDKDLDILLSMGEIKLTENGKYV
ncbi:hypothetical protein AB4124_06110 [Paenibacillus sp. 2KB_20]|uniref:hypothetical protein n=1 Tax=Paenibacillus sp. 2KB_20 TaxID=3232977 RepID=UPI003F962581